MNRILVLLATVATLVLISAWSPGPAAAGWPGPDGEYDWPRMKKCGSFPTTEYRIYVYANKRTGCGKARAVLKAWWLAEPGDVVHHDDHVTIKRRPAWRCDSGAGGGGCRKGKRFAGYQN